MRYRSQQGHAWRPRAEQEASGADLGAVVRPGLRACGQDERRAVPSAVPSVATTPADLPEADVRASSGKGCLDHCSVDVGACRAAGAATASTTAIAKVSVTRKSPRRDRPEEPPTCSAEVREHIRARKG